MKQYGLVYKADDLEVWLGRFDEHLAIKSFESISDIEGIYDDLNGKFAFVEVVDEGDRRWLNDIRTFSLFHDDQDSRAEDFLKEIEFPGPEADVCFAIIYREGLTPEKMN